MQVVEWTERQERLRGSQEAGASALLCTAQLAPVTLPLHLHLRR